MYRYQINFPPSLFYHKHFARICTGECKSFEKESVFLTDYALAIGGGALAVMTAPVALTAAGFTSAGIAAGSLAATAQSAGLAGSTFAAMQSAGAAGLGVGGTVATFVGGAKAAQSMGEQLKGESKK